jgi:hypothetical protein
MLIEGQTNRRRPSLLSCARQPAPESGEAWTKPHKITRQAHREACESTRRATPLLGHGDSSAFGSERGLIDGPLGPGRAGDVCCRALFSVWFCHHLGLRWNSDDRARVPYPCRCASVPRALTHCLHGIPSGWSHVAPFAVRRPAHRPRHALASTRSRGRCHIRTCPSTPRARRSASGSSRFSPVRDAMPVRNAGRRSGSGKPVN